MLTNQRSYGYPAALLVAVLLIPFIYTAFFTFAEADDFQYALRAKFFFDFPTAIKVMGRAWWTWSGRYSHHFLSIFFGDFAASRVAYTIIVLFFHAVAWLSIFGIIRELGRRPGTGQAVFMATFFWFATLCSHGEVNGWFLYVELVSLVGGYCGILLYIWSLCRLWNAPVATRGVKIFCVASGILAIGMYEHGALMGLFITLVAWLLAKVYDHPHRGTFSLLVKVAVVCFLLNYLARGNFRRQTKRGMDFALMYGQVLSAGKDWMAHIWPAYCNPIYLASLFGAVWFVPGWKVPLEKKMSAPLILLGCLVLLFAYSFGLTLVHAMSDVPVSKVGKVPANIVQYSAVIVFFALLSCREWLHLDALRRLGKAASLVIILGVLVAGNSNFFPVLWDGVLGETVRFAQGYEKRKKVMAEHQAEELAVMRLLYSPLAITGDSLSENPDRWPNTTAAPFYGLKKIRIVLPSYADAFAAAQASGVLTWQDAGGGNTVAYVASLSLPSNATYEFDWLFVESQNDARPLVRLVIVPESSFLASLPESWGMFERIGKGEWPFRKTFRRPIPQPLNIDGRHLFAIPLPLSDSAATKVGADTFISINGGSLVPAMGGASIQTAP